MVDGLETVSNSIARCYALEGLYIQQSATTTVQRQLEQSISGLYSAILTYLFESKRYYAQNTAGLSVEPIIYGKG